MFAYTTPSDVHSAPSSHNKDANRHRTITTVSLANSEACQENPEAVSTLGCYWTC